MTTIKATLEVIVQFGSKHGRNAFVFFKGRVLTIDIVGTFETVGGDVLSNPVGVAISTIERGDIGISIDEVVDGTLKKN